MIRIILVTLLLNLMACTSQFQEYPSSSVDVIPIKFSMQIDSQSEGFNTSKQNVNSFVKHHNEQLLAQDVLIKYSNRQAKKLADYVHVLLLKQGVNPSRITVKVEAVANDKDFEISYTEHKLQAPICTYEQIERLGEQPANCAVEGARWKSMLHPNKMLSQS